MLAGMTGGTLGRHTVEESLSLRMPCIVGNKVGCGVRLRITKDGGEALLPGWRL